MLILKMAAAQTVEKWYNINVTGKNPVKVEVAGSDKVTVTKVQTYAGESQIVVKKNNTTIGTYPAKGTTITCDSVVINQNIYNFDYDWIDKYCIATFAVPLRFPSGNAQIFPVKYNQGIGLYDTYNKTTYWYEWATLNKRWQEAATAIPGIDYDKAEGFVLTYDHVDKIPCMVYKVCINTWIYSWTYYPMIGNDSGATLYDVSDFSYNNNTPKITTVKTKNNDGSLTMSAVVSGKTVKVTFFGWKAAPIVE